MKKLKDRIRDAIQASGGQMEYYACMHVVFPEDKYPKAWRYQANGGPPGCAMAFGKALREMGGRRTGIGGASKVWVPVNHDPVNEPHPPTDGLPERQKN